MNNRRKIPVQMIYQIIYLTIPNHSSVSYTHLDVYKRQSYANEVLDDIAGKLADLLAELKTEKDSFKKLGIDYEEKAF